MDNRTSYYVGTDKDCLKFIDFLISDGREYEYYGLDDYTSAVKFWSPFITPAEFKRIEGDY